MTTKEKYQLHKEDQKARARKRYWQKRDEILEWKRQNKDRLHTATKEKKSKRQKNQNVLNKKIVIDHYSDKGFRILCLNCNFSLGKFGYCPHKGAN